MHAFPAALLALACLLPAAASAQWQWVDKDGRKVFSDRPPPADIPVKNILKQPGGSKMRIEEAPAPEAAASAPTPAAVAKAAASAPRLSGKDKELEEKKKQAEAAEAEKKKAQEAEVAAARTENCNRARGAKAAYDSGVRITRTNDKGEREFLDDKQRAAELKRIEAIIARDCAPRQ